MELVELVELGMLGLCFWFFGIRALDKQSHKRLATVFDCQKRQKGRKARCFFHIWICFNAFIQMHLRYCPTATS